MIAGGGSLARLIRRVDADGDGVITRAELAAAVARGTAGMDVGREGGATPPPQREISFDEAETAQVIATDGDRLPLTAAGCHGLQPIATNCLWLPLRTALTICSTALVGLPRAQVWDAAVKRPFGTAKMLASLERKVRLPSGQCYPGRWIHLMKLIRAAPSDDHSSSPSEHHPATIHRRRRRAWRSGCAWREPSIVR